MVSKATYQRYFNLIKSVNPKYRELVSQLDPKSAKDVKIYKNIVKKPALDPVSAAAQIRVMKGFYENIIKDPSSTAAKFARKRGLMIEKTNLDPAKILKNQDLVKKFKKPIIATPTPPKRLIKEKEYTISDSNEIATKAGLALQYAKRYRYSYVRLILKMVIGGQDTFISTSIHPNSQIGQAIAQLQSWIGNLGGDEEYYNYTAIDSFEALICEFR